MKLVLLEPKENRVILAYKEIKERLVLRVYRVILATLDYKEVRGQLVLKVKLATLVLQV